MFMLVPAVFVLENSFFQVNQFRCKRPKNEEVLWTILWTILAGSDWHPYRHQIFAICSGSLQRRTRGRTKCNTLHITQSNCCLHSLAELQAKPPYRSGYS